MPRRIVIAIGGNAIIKETEEGTVAQQFANTRATVRQVVELLKLGYEIVLTHGNGPQVGNILIRVEAALGKAYSIPVGVAVGQSQGEMGYMIGQSLQNQLRREGIDRPVAVLLTQVICNSDDPALNEPTKPIGPFHDQETAERLREEGFQLVEDSGRGYRVVVPSPKPKRIVESDSVDILMRAGVVVIAAGGGGMPVYELPDGAFEGIDGVVDKDFASALLARQLGAQDVIFLTGVEQVQVDFGTPDARALRDAATTEMREHAAAGQFPPGSMGPKVMAAVEFLERGGQRALITSSDRLSDAFLRNECGTWIRGAGQAVPGRKEAQ